MSEELRNNHATHLVELFNEILDERDRQDRKFPLQAQRGCPNGTGPDGVFLGHRFSTITKIARNFVDRLAKTDENAWIGILLEEVFEAAEEDRPDRLRTELVQVMAVVAAWLEDLDRKNPVERVGIDG